MPKIVQPEEFDEIAKAIARLPAGAALDDIAAGIGGELSRRTLQRRLAELVAEGRITGGREKKAFKYRLAAAPKPFLRVAESVGPAAPGEHYVLLSAEGAEIQTYVRRPVHQRRPVGYNLAFLQAYTPNVTCYLPAKLRAELRELGRSPAALQPAGTFARDILGRLLIDLSWASSRLEGNTYSRLDTERLIHFGEVAEGKDAIETQMILNHKAAIEYLVHEVDRVGVNTETIIALHALLSDRLLPNPLACGRLRNFAVGIGGSVYLPLSLPQPIADLFASVADMAAEIEDPFEQAFFLMVHLPYLQPFEDVNKRVSRLAANIPLIKHNLCPLSFIGLPEKAYVDALLGVYELNRVELLRDVFASAYERSCQQYVAVVPQLVPPDKFWLRYRTALAEVVRAIVRGGLAANIETIQKILPAAVATEDHARFTQLVVDEFKSLHAGNAIRYGIRPLELEAWRAMVGG
jgi:Fic family protein